MRSAALALLAILAGGCAAGHEPLSLSPSTPVSAEDYEEVLMRWTRQDKLYQRFSSILFVHATFHSPEFRRVFLLRHQDIYGRGSEAAARINLTAEGAEEYLEFFVSAWTADGRANDFDRPDSIWRVSLSEQAEGAEVVTGKVERIRTTPNLRAIYPYISDFARTYAIRFPRTTPAGEPIITSKSTGFVLRFSSALGVAELRWELIPAR